MIRRHWLSWLVNIVIKALQGLLISCFIAVVVQLIRFHCAIGLSITLIILSIVSIVITEFVKVRFGFSEKSVMEMHRCYDKLIWEKTQLRNYVTKVLCVVMIICTAYLCNISFVTEEDQALGESYIETMDISSTDNLKAFPAIFSNKFYYSGAFLACATNYQKYPYSTDIEDAYLEMSDKFDNYAQAYNVLRIALYGLCFVYGALRTYRYMSYSAQVWIDSDYGKKTHARRTL